LVQEEKRKKPQMSQMDPDVKTKWEEKPLMTQMDADGEREKR